jgi:predicted transposase YdaD
VLKEGEQRFDGVLLTPVEGAERPVVILEVQMIADALFFHRLPAETARYLQQHPGVRHWQAVVLTPWAWLLLECGSTADLTAWLAWALTG